MKTWLLPYVAMVMVQFAYAGSNILCKAALENGMSFFIFVVYRHIIAIFILGPFAYFLERKIRPALTLTLAMWIFTLALCGTTIQQNLYYAGLSYSSPTVASALNNLIPAVTFLSAALLRIEPLCFRSRTGRAKILGTMISISGALVFTLWKGRPLYRLRSPLINIYGKSSANQGIHDWVRGSLLLSTSNIAFSLYLTLQVMVFKRYAAPLFITALTGLFASFQSFLVAIAFEKRMDAWRVEWNIQLITIIYCGIILSIVVYYLQTWCIKEKGPVFVSMFTPLLIVLIGLISVVILGEQLHLGSLIGAIIIVVGFYSVLWGKSKEGRVTRVEDNKSEEESSAVEEVGDRTDGHATTEKRNS